MVTFLSDYAFADCHALTTITISGSVTTIGYQAFANSNLLKNVTFQDGTGTLTLNTAYNEYTFNGCPIETLYIGRPLSFSNASYLPFAGKATIKTVTFGNVSTITGIHYNLFKNCTGLTSVTFPNSEYFTSIGESAFEGCKALPTVTIPNSVTDIYNNAFSGCESLTSITIPNSVTTIREEAFTKCNLLKTVTFQEGTSTLTLNTAYQSYIFTGSPIETVTLGRNLSYSASYPPLNIATLKTLTISAIITSIPQNCFYGCTALSTITSNPTTPPTLGSDAFKNVPATATLKVPCITAYQNSAWGTKFTNVGGWVQTGTCPADNTTPLYTLKVLSSNTAYGHATSTSLASGAILTSTFSGTDFPSVSTQRQFNGKALLIASAKANAVFTGWSDGNSEPVRIVSIAANKEVTAQFAATGNGSNVDVTPYLNRISRLQQDSTELIAQVTNLQTQLQNCGSDDNSALLAQITALQSEKEALHTQIASLQGQLAACSTGNNADLLEQLNIANGTIATLQSDKVALQTEIASLQAQLTAISNSDNTALLTQLNTANRTIAMLQSDNTTLQNQLSTANGNINALQSDKATLQAQISSLQAQINACASGNSAALFALLNTANNTIATLQSDKTSLQNQLSAANGYIAVLQSDKSVLQTQLTNANNAKATLQADFNNANATISDLQVQLNACKEAKPTAVSDNEFTPTTVYPNPTNGELRIKNSKITAGDAIEVFTTAGQRVAIFTATGPETLIDLSGLAAGTYIVRVNGESVKVVKE